MDRYYSVAAAENCSPKDDLRCAFSSWIFTIIQPTILGIGTVGNTLSILVLSRQAFRSKPILILLPLAVFDIIFLWADTINVKRWNISQNNDQMREQFTKTVEQISHFARGSSNLVIALFTIVRLISTLFPVAAKVWFSTKRTFIILTLLVILCGIQTGFMFYGFQHFNPHGEHDLTVNTTNNITGCYLVSTDYGEYCSLVQLIYIVLFIFVPLSIALIGNIALIIKLKCFKRVTSTAAAQDSQTNILFPITGFLFITSVVIGVGVIIKKMIGDQKTSTVILVGAIVYNVQLSNYAVNFLLYLWKGTLFKGEFKSMCREIYDFVRARGLFRNANRVAPV